MPSPVRPPQAARVAACTRPYGTRLATLGSRTQVRDPFALLWRPLAPDGAKWPQVRAQMGLCGTVTGWSAGKSPGLPWIRVRGAPQPTPRHPLRGPFMGSPARTWGHFAPFRSLLALPPGPIPLGAAHGLAGQAHQGIEAAFVHRGAGVSMLASRIGRPCRAVPFRHNVVQPHMGSR